jgi:hypothetical protein
MPDDEPEPAQKHGVKEAKTLYEHPANCLIAKVQKEHIEQLGSKP